MPPATAPVARYACADRAVRRTPSITLLEGVEARRLIVEDNAIKGVLAAGETARCHRHERVIIATGGIGGLFVDSTTGRLLRTGPRLAAHAGAQLADLEFVHSIQRLRRAVAAMPLLTEAIRGDGAILIDDTGQRFMAETQGAELAARDIVARAVMARRAPRDMRVPGCAKTSRQRLCAALSRHQRVLQNGRHRSCDRSIPVRPRCTTTWVALPWIPKAAAR